MREFHHIGIPVGEKTPDMVYYESIKCWATDPDGPHRLLVPVAAAEAFREAVAALPASERMRWQRHAVRQGDTLGGIARI